MINNRLHELSVTYKAHQKLKGNLKNLFKTVKNVKDEQTKCSSWVKEQLKAIGGEVQEKTRGMLDEVGKQVELEVKALGERLQNKR
jgi:transposase